jgi:hypothetical protein
MIAGGKFTREITMKILGLGSMTPRGKVVTIKRDGVVIIENGVKVVLTFADVEKMMNV